MARTIAVWGSTGLATPTLKLMLRSALTTVVETITLTEHGTVKRLYTGTVTASAGQYRFNLLTAGSFVGGGTITILGTDGTTSEEDAPINSGNVRTEINRSNGVNPWPIYGDGALFPIDATDNAFASFGSGLWDGSKWCYYYTAIDGAGKLCIRRVTSVDGKTSFSARTTVMTAGLTYDSGGCWSPQPWKEGSTYHMIYAGQPDGGDQTCLYATSTDGLTWTKAGTILAATVDWEHDKIEPTDVMKVGSTYYLYYCTSGFSAGFNATDRRVGYATATTLTGPWTKGTEPIFGTTDEASLANDGLGRYSPAVFASSQIATYYYMAVAVYGPRNNFGYYELWESYEPTFNKNYRRRVGVIQVVNDLGTFPDGELDMACFMADDITKLTFAVAGEVRFLFGAKHSGSWLMALSTKATVDEAVRQTLPITLDRIAEISTSFAKATELATANTTLGSIVTTLAAMAATVWSYATRTLTSFAGLAGFGARTVTIAVQTSGSVAIQGAIVRVTLSGASYAQTTNSSGQVTFNLDDGTWTVAITKSGYTYAGTTLVVDGDETATYTMTTNSVSAPAAPNLAVGTLLCLGTDGLPEADVDIVFRMTIGPGTAGYALDAAEFTETSDASGEVEASFVRGATYTARRGTVGREVTFVAPASASFTLPESLGAP